ncbi:MAG: restriction endonuclease subunit S [Candidatus Aenigmarchaeota archaeon]|nr:restriction endonuclease subunit S [Candidatus Aenigmarchaeota archaeon]
MLSDWTEHLWGEIASLEYGKALRNYKKNSGEYPVYGTNGQIGWTGCPLVNNSGIIIGRKGAYRGIHYSPIPFFIIDTAFYLKPKDIKELDIKFAYYALLTQDINSMDSGSAIPSTSREDFYALSIKLPPINEQQSIAKILFDLDLKIELNQQMNRTLEAMGQALFKHWFIDFEFPNEEGNPYKSSGGAIIDSELGEIPKGWKIVNLDEIVEITSSKRIFMSEYKKSGIPFFRSKEIIELHNGKNVSLELFISKEKYEEIKNKYGVPKYKDILLTSVGTIGISYRVKNKDCFYFKDGNLTWFRSFKKDFYSDFIFAWLNNKQILHTLDAITIGSTQKAITINGLNSLKLILPNDRQLKIFSEVFSLIAQKKEILFVESNILTELRDTLLPKLMSGQIRVLLSGKESAI